MTEKKAIAHVYSSFNNTILTVSDITAAETIATYSGGMVVRSGREKPSPFAAMEIAKKAADDLKAKGFGMVDVQIRAPGGTRAKSPGSGAQSIIRSLTRAGIKIGKIEDTTPIAHGKMSKKGGKRGRRV